MKRISLLLAIVCFIVDGFAQINVRQTADDYLNEGKLDNALANINRCIMDQSTSMDAKSWLIRGNIYMEISNSNDENYKALDPNPLKQAFDSYKKAYEFDQKKEYIEEISSKVNWLRNNSFNQAVEYYNNKFYREAMLAFENGATALESINISDTLSLFYAAACAGLAGEKTNAKQDYIKLLKQNAKSITIYISLAELYRQEGDFTGALQIVRDGQKIYPDDLKLFLTETNIYLTSGDTQKALQYLKSAAEKDTSNPTIFFALGTIFEAIFNDTFKSMDERQDAYGLAIDSYKSAIELNPDYYEPNYNLGALFVNQAATIIEKANKLPLDADAEYKKLDSEAGKYLDEATPYLEKASEIQPEDLNTLWSLKQIYTRTNKTDKLKIITDKIEILQNR
jgi:tetratricopeptide (TPR) repeat protein